MSKKYVERTGPAIQALADVSVAVDAKECVAILGPSGCGNSTLLNLVAGLLAPTRGSVSFEDIVDTRFVEAAVEAVGE